jgi:2'-5' RNA ligase
MRAFIGIPISKELRDKISSFYPVFGRTGGIKFVEPKNLHITLNFLGDINEDMIKSVGNAVDNAVDGLKRFDILCRKISAFPSLKKASVIWADCAEGGGRVEEIYNRLSDNLEPLGFLKESRPYTAHITIGRCRVHRDITHEAGTIEINTEDTVAGVVLFKSVISQAGPEYSIIYERKLTA